MYLYSLSYSGHWNFFFFFFLSNKDFKFKYKMFRTIPLSWTALGLLFGAAMAEHKLTVWGKHDPAMIDDMVQSLGGSLGLTGLAESPDSYISDLLLIQDLEAEAQTGMDFGLPAHVFSNTTIDQARHEVDLLARVPVYEGAPTCYATGDSTGYRLLTVAQQKYIAGPACNAVAATTPYVFALIAVKIGNLACVSHTSLS